MLLYSFVIFIVKYYYYYWLESITPDLISSILIVLRDHNNETKQAITTLEGLSNVSNFPLMLSLLPENDLECLNEIFKKISNDNNNNQEESINNLRIIYKIKWV